MKKFAFRLETVHRVRTIQDELARGELLAANHQLAKADTIVDERNIKAAAITRPLGTSTVSAFACAQFVIDQAADAIRWAERDRAAVAVVAQERRELWIAANTKLRAVDRLRDTARDEHHSNVLHDEATTNDEIATMRHRAKATAL